MTKLEVLEYPDERLRQRAAPVVDFDASLHRLVEDLFDTMAGSEAGIGLCAPQVGVAKQVLVMDLSRKGEAREVYINPKITGRALFGFIEESCLSVPGENVNVWRATQIRVEAYDQHGVPFEREIERLAAVCLQHEMDHFAGKLLVDRMSFFRRRRFKRARAALDRAASPALSETRI